MIKINLLGDRPEFETTRVLQVVGFSALMVFSIVACVFIQIGMNANVAAMTEEKSKLDMELAKLKKITKEVEGLEDKKKLLREKLNTISILKLKKHGPVHILDDLNIALPERAWVNSVKERNGFLEISGVAFDNQTIAVFMNKLSQGKYFGDIRLVHSTQVVKDNIKLKSFLMMVEIKNPLAEAAKKQAEAQKGQAAKSDDNNKGTPEKEQPQATQAGKV